VPLQNLEVRAAEIAKRPFGVNLYGFLETKSGLGQVSRGYLRALQCQNASIPTNTISVAPWKGGFEARALPSFTPFRINLIQQNADMMARFTGAYGTTLLNGCYNIAIWFWELPSIRSDWFQAYRYVDEIWVASEFCRQSVQSMTSLPVRRMPLVVDGLERSAIFDRKHFGLPEDAFLFCYVFDLSSQFERKNPLALVRAFRSAFGDSPDVFLCLKYSNSAFDPQALQQLHASIDGAANILTFDSLFSDEEIISFHNVADCLVSPHRSEGFGFNLAEAMYLGKPVIATGYSSNLDFMTDQNSYLIDYKLVPVRAQCGPYLKNAVWAEPSEEHLAHLLRRVFENPQEREAKARQAAQDIRRQFSCEHVGDAIRARFQEIGLDQPVPALKLKEHRLLPRSMAIDQVPSEAAQAIHAWREKPLISIITPVYNVDALLLRRCIESVKAQWYPRWELCICDDASTRDETLHVLDDYQGRDPRIKIIRSPQNGGIATASNRAVEISTGELVAMLDNDDELAPQALYEIVAAFNTDPDLDLFYSDEDKIEPNGELSEPYFKPDWSPEHLNSVMYMLHLLVIRKELFYRIGGFRSEFSGAQDFDLALRASVGARKIFHIPKILYHWRKIPGSAAATVDAKPLALEAGRRALEDHVKQTQPNASVEPGKLTGHFRVRHQLWGEPRASLCITTNDSWAEVEGRGNINLVEHLVKSIELKTDYRNFEIIVCDNGNLSQRTRAAMADIPYRLVSYPGPLHPFNFADKANYMFKEARYEHVVLLNDDLEIISAEWLRALLEFSQLREVGAVGARLLFPDDRIQHVGVVLGVNGGAAHVYHGYPASFIGYNGFTHIVRNYSAVTGACMATRKEVIEELGGFDVRFAIDYNDIDYCLRAVERGYRIVYTPYAELYHFEGQTARRREASPLATRLFRERWPRYIENDPFYNPNLTRNGVDFAPARP